MMLVLGIQKSVWFTHTHTHTHTHMCVYAQSLSHVQLFATQWAVAQQVPLSMGFTKQGYWSGCHDLYQGIFLTQGLNPYLLCLLQWQTNSLPPVPCVLVLQFPQGLEPCVILDLFFMAYYSSQHVTGL